MASSNWENEGNPRDTKRSELVKMASTLFLKQGFKKTTMDSIAALFHKGKTTLYYYFDNKKSIFSAVVEWECSNIYQAIESYTLEKQTLADLASTESLDVQAALLRYVEKVVEIGDTVLLQRKNILKEYNSFQRLIKSIISSFKQSNTLLLESLLRYGLEKGQLIGEKEDINLKAYAIFRICFTYYGDIMQDIDFSFGCEELQKIVLLIAQDSAGGQSSTP